MSSPAVTYTRICGVSTGSFGCGMPSSCTPCPAASVMSAASVAPDSRPRVSAKVMQTCTSPAPSAPSMACSAGWPDGFSHAHAATSPMASTIPHSASLLQNTESLTRA